MNHSGAEISVVVPCYNRASQLKSCLESIRSQTFQNFEVIVVDDGSDMDLKKVVNSLADTRFYCIRQENAGPAAARNQGVQFAKGRIVTFLDSDDRAASEWLSVLMDEFVDDSVAVVCCGSVRTIEGTEFGQGISRMPKSYGPAFGSINGLFNGAGVYAIKRELFQKIGGFDPDIKTGEHTELALRLTRHVSQENIKNIYLPLVYYIDHDGERAFGNPASRYRGSTAMLKKHGNALSADPKMMASYCAVAGVNAARIGRYGDARHHLRQSVIAYPLSAKVWGRMLLAHIPGFMRWRWGNATTASNSERSGNRS